MIEDPMSYQEFGEYVEERIAGYPPGSWVKVEWTTTIPNDMIEKHVEKVAKEHVAELLIDHLIPTAVLKGVKIDPWPEPEN